MRLLLVTAAALASAGLALSGVAGATASATISPVTAVATTAADEREPGTFIEYTGTVTRVHVGDGETNKEDPVAATAGIQCDDNGCELYGIGVLSHGFGPFAIDGGESTIELPGVVAACDYAEPRQATIAVTATATSMRVIATTPESGWMNCEDGQLLHWGAIDTFEGAFSSGDPCVLTGAVCPPEPEPVVEPESAETPPPAASRGPAAPPCWQPCAPPRRSSRPRRCSRRRSQSCS